MRWATRCGVHIDRAACAWLIRRFIDPDAEFAFVDDPVDVPPDVTPFDMRGVDLSHHGDDCSFETFLHRYALDDPVLWDVARIVHEADPEVLRADAMRNYSIYGVYGISVFALRDATLDELAQLPPLVRFRALTLMTAGTIRGAGLRIEPTGRNPVHFDVCFDDLDSGVTRLCSCDHRVVLNPYHEA